MTADDFISKIAKMLNQEHTGMLTTREKDETTTVHRMSPYLLPKDEEHLYAITKEPDQVLLTIGDEDTAQWCIQTPNMTEVASLDGKIRVVDNPDARKSILNKMKQMLKDSEEDLSDYTVLETSLQKGTYCQPMSNHFEEVAFAEMN